MDTTYSDEYPGAIYFNKDGFKPALRSKVTEIPTEFSLLPTGYTAKKDE
jgi:hypothetical protein